MTSLFLGRLTMEFVILVLGIFWGFTAQDVICALRTGEKEKLEVIEDPESRNALKKIIEYQETALKALELLVSYVRQSDQKR